MNLATILPLFVGLLVVAVIVVTALAVRPSERVPVPHAVAPLQSRWSLLASLLSFLRDEQESRPTNPNAKMPSAPRWDFMGFIITFVVLLTPVAFLIWCMDRPAAKSTTTPDSVSDSTQSDPRDARWNRTEGGRKLIETIAGETNRSEAEVRKALNDEIDRRGLAEYADKGREVTTVRPKERRYRDRSGAIARESVVEKQISEVRETIASMPNNSDRAALTGLLRALEDEWARIKRQGPIEE